MARQTNNLGGQYGGSGAGPGYSAGRGGSSGGSGRWTSPTGYKIARKGSGTAILQGKPKTLNTGSGGTKPKVAVDVKPKSKAVVDVKPKSKAVANVKLKSKAAVEAKPKPKSDGGTMYSKPKK